jgi:uracil-DNA glycosylase family 4
VTEAERRAALEAIADEVRVCTRCRLHETRTKAVPGEGDASTEVMFVGEGPGMNEDREGRPFVGRAGGLLVTLLGHIGWFRDDVFITNIVKCRPPGNRDPEPDEIAACAPYLERQLQALDPSVVVTLGRYSMGRFMPGVRISQAHGTTRIADPATGARDATVFAMYHPAAALRTPAIERESYEDVALIPTVLTEARARRAERRRAAAAAAGSVAPDASHPATTPPSPDSAATSNLPAAEPASSPTPPDAEPAADQLSLF